MLLFLWVACNSPSTAPERPRSPTESGSPPTDSGAASSPRPASMSVVLGRDGPDNGWLAAVVHPEPLAWGAAACLNARLPCLDPTTTRPSSVPEGPWGWAGDVVRVGRLWPFLNDPARGLAGYFGSISWAESPVPFRMEGQLGLVQGEIPSPPAWQPADLQDGSWPAGREVVVRWRAEPGEQAALVAAAGAEARVLAAGSVGELRGVAEAGQRVALWRWREGRWPATAGEVHAVALTVQEWTVQADLPASCREARALGQPTGPTALRTTTGEEILLWCDQDRAGGGWTLVGASRGEPLTDEAGPWHPDLARPAPEGHQTTLLNLLAAGNDGRPTDLRFTCQIGVDGGEPAVDLVFYRVPWYRSLIAGTEQESCFLAADDAEEAAPLWPARWDVVGQQRRAEGTPTRTGQLVGEDRCDAPDDFTIDFDDRGMDSDQADGTDWGIDDGLAKCGRENPADASWQLWVR